MGALQIDEYTHLLDDDIDGEIMPGVSDVTRAELVTAAKMLSDFMIMM